MIVVKAVCTLSNEIVLYTYHSQVNDHRLSVSRRKGIKRPTGDKTKSAEIHKYGASYGLTSLYLVSNPEMLSSHRSPLNSSPDASGFSFCNDPSVS